MKKTLCVSTLLLLGAQPMMAQERPNIIVFLVDDMGLMDTSLPFLTDAEGNPVRHPLNDWYQTPNMERQFAVACLYYDRTKLYPARYDQLDQFGK